MDELFKELGRKPNIGYVLTPQKKEYLKFKEKTNRSMFPSNTIYEHFQTLFTTWREIGEKAIETLCTEVVVDPKTKQSATLIEADELENLKKFGRLHSSISLIRYFSKLAEAGDVEAEAKLSEDEKLCNRTVEIPLGKHVDTGVITLILSSDVPGLQMLDRRSNQYFFCEKAFPDPKYMFVIAGRKMEMFSWKKKIHPTWHFVQVPTDTVRYSTMYFMEIQKDH